MDVDVDTLQPTQPGALNQPTHCRDATGVMTFNDDDSLQQDALANTNTEEEAELVQIPTTHTTTTTPSYHTSTSTPFPSSFRPPQQQPQLKVVAAAAAAQDALAPTLPLHATTSTLSPATAAGLGPGPPLATTTTPSPAGSSTLHHTVSKKPFAPSPPVRGQEANFFFFSFFLLKRGCPTSLLDSPEKRTLSDGRNLLGGLEVNVVISADEGDRD